MSALPPKADIANLARYVRFVPLADKALAQGLSPPSRFKTVCKSRMGGAEVDFRRLPARPDDRQL